MVFGEFKDKEKEVVSGVVQRREGRVVLVDLGKAVGVLLHEDQIPGEFYRPGRGRPMAIQLESGVASQETQNRAGRDRGFQFPAPGFAGAASAGAGQGD